MWFFLNLDNDIDPSIAYILITNANLFINDVGGGERCVEFMNELCLNSGAYRYKLLKHVVNANL